MDLDVSRRPDFHSISHFFKELPWTTQLLLLRKLAWEIFSNAEKIWKTLLMKNLSHFFVKFFFPGGKKTFLREIFDLEFTIQSFFSSSSIFWGWMGWIQLKMVMPSQKSLQRIWHWAYFFVPELWMRSWAVFPEPEPIWAPQKL